MKFFLENLPEPMWSLARAKSIFLAFSMHSEYDDSLRQAKCVCKSSMIYLTILVPSSSGVWLASVCYTWELLLGPDEDAAPWCTDPWQRCNQTRSKITETSFGHNSEDDLTLDLATRFALLPAVIDLVHSCPRWSDNLDSAFHLISVVKFVRF